ncbi:MAG TPA: phosphate signaling complex protein PhoU [Aggregatilineales bacterium]|nr:phosphate signaling complex protein PhoU [Aggregatilineales bacterium]
MRTRSALDHSYAEISDNLLRLTSMVDRALVDAMKALIDRDGKLAQNVSQGDSALNDLRYSIEESCYTLLATQAPTATDLRNVMGAVSVATNLERIGDHAAGIARLTLRMVDQSLLRPLVDIPQMAELVRAMIKDAVRAFLEHSPELAENVVQRDNDVDALQTSVYDTLISFMTHDPSTVKRATYLLWVSHNLERSGDRATNICERAIYATTGVLKELH